MIDLYASGSPNVLKIIIMLEEMCLPYTTKYISVLHGANFEPAFLALNPLGKVPVIVDHDGAGNDHPLFESGAILIYLAETYRSPLLPAGGTARWEVLKWLMVQMSYVGPMLGQVNHFQLIPSETDGYASTRYRDQALRIYRQLDNRLAGSQWLGGDDYSIADISVYPWTGFLARHGFDIADYPKLSTWRDRIDERAAVQRAVAAFKKMSTDGQPSAAPTDKQLDGLFGRCNSGPPADLRGYLALGPMTTASESGSFSQK